MGDGINDAPALHAADVGISVDTAVDIAKESADMILLEKSLLVLDEGVLEGRKVFANIIKYVRMGASSNFGNMFSVLGASIFVPFLPMLPIQILTNNLLYDIGQTTIPTDAVDAEQIQRPAALEHQGADPIHPVHRAVLVDLRLHHLSPDALPVRVLEHLDAAAAAHSASLFQTGWFVESLLTQTLIIHVIRTNKIPFLQSRASRPVLLMGLLIMAIGIGLSFSRAGRYLGFTALPGLYWPLLGAHARLLPRADPGREDVAAATTLDLRERVTRARPAVPESRPARHAPASRAPGARSPADPALPGAAPASRRLLPARGRGRAAPPPRSR